MYYYQLALKFQQTDSADYECNIQYNNVMAFYNCFEIWLIQMNLSDLLRIHMKLPPCKKKLFSAKSTWPNMNVEWSLLQVTEVAYNYA